MKETPEVQLKRQTEDCTTLLAQLQAKLREMKQVHTGARDARGMSSLVRCIAFLD